MKNKYIFIYIILIGSLLIANSRVAFSRPGALIRTSSYEAYDPNKFPFDEGAKFGEWAV